MDRKIKQYIAVPTLLMPGFQVVPNTVLRDITNFDTPGKLKNNTSTASTSAANKLMNVKLDHGETVKNKLLKKRILEEKQRIKRALAYIRAKQDSDRICRLCLTPGGQNIFKDEADLCSDIKYALGIEIRECDGGPQYICPPCKTITHRAARLKRTAEITQWRLQQELELVAEDKSDDVEESSSKKPHGGYFRAKDSSIVREWACSKCSRLFQSEQEFSQHVSGGCRSRRGTGPGCVCEVCGRALRTLFLLQRHRMTHSNTPGAFKCNYCSYRCRTKYGLAVHVRGHTGDRPVQCPVCSKSFPSAATLWAHKKRHLPPSYHCNICAKGFRYKELFQEHMLSQHSNEKSFHCCSCGKAYATRKKVLRHERTVHNRPRLREPTNTRPLLSQSAD